MSVRKHIPNAITSLNLFCGVLGIIVTLQYGNLPLAFKLMLLSVAFDFCDGLAARLLGAYSETGKELDSLADLVSFGVLPSVMMFSAMEEAWPQWCFVPLLLVVASAMRLAKFNLDERQHESFLGLPTPACALLCGSVCALGAMAPESFAAELCASAWFLPCLSAGLGILLVSEVPMFSFKFGKDMQADAATNRKRCAIIAIGAAVIALTVCLALPWTAAFAGIFASYILLNLIFAVLGV